MSDPEYLSKLAAKMIGKHIPIRVHSASVLESYGCLMIDDLLMVSVADAHLALQRAEMNERLSKFFSFMPLRWLLVQLWNLLIWGGGHPELMLIKIKKETPSGKAESRDSGGEGGNSGAGDLPADAAAPSGSPEEVHVVLGSEV